MSVLLRSLNMATELKDYIKIYDNVIDKSFADKVIQTFDLDFENHEYIDFRRCFWTKRLKSC